MTDCLMKKRSNFTEDTIVMNEQNRSSFWGYLKVKRPADQRYTFIRPLFGWRKRLITVLLDESTKSDPRTNVVRVLLGKKQAISSILATKNESNNPKNNDLQKRLFASRNCIELKSNNCVIYRCRSRKESHAFVLANQTRPLLYLAASNEVPSQHWIKTLREALWPSNAQQAALEDEKKVVFPVSLVDNEYSFRANMVGIYGYLAFDLPHKLVLRNSQNGTLIQDFDLNTVSMRLIGEAADQSFALIERVQLNNEHVFVEMNSDFVPNHLDQDENLNRASEQFSSDCYLVLMNCSMDATNGPGLITFFSENAYQLVKQFKKEKRQDLAERRRKQQTANETNILIEDLIPDTDAEYGEENSDFNKINEKMNGKSNSILYRKLSNALGFNDSEYEDMDSNMISVKENQTHSTNDQEKLINNQNLEPIETPHTISLIEQTRGKQLLFDHKLPFYASTELLVSNSSTQIGSMEMEQLSSQTDEERKNKSSRSNDRTYEFDSSLSSS